MHAKSLLLAPLFACALNLDLPAQQPPSLVKDLNAIPLANGSSDPGGFVTIGSWIYFAGRQFSYGSTDSDRELLRTLGVSGNTELVKDIWPGSLGSNPSRLTLVGSTLFFQASSNFVTGLWKSDGTEAGTVFVLEKQIQEPLAYANKLYFLWGNSLWSSDGSAAGTVQIKDFPGPPFATSNTENLIQASGSLFLAADDGTGNRALWKSDGTTAGTTMLKVVDILSTDQGPMLPFAGGVAFVADDPTVGQELWTSDGTPVGTQLLLDINTGTGDAFPRRGPFIVPKIYLATVGSNLCFSATDGQNGQELWCTDGTALNTILVKDIQVGSASSSPTELTEMGGSLYFAATDASNGTELWKSDGTVAGTALLKDINPGLDGGGQANSSLPERLYATTDRLFFTATTAATGRELWYSDGTASFTFLALDINPGSGNSNAKNFAPAQLSRIIFTANDGSIGNEIWSCDGVPQTTLLAEDVNSPPFGSTGASLPQLLVDAFGTTYFFALADSSNWGLFKTDGSTAGTSLIKTVNAGGVGARSLILVGERLFFPAGDGTNGTELWTSDGSTAGTLMVKDIWPGTGNSQPEELTGMAGKVYFSAEDGSNGRELWKSDGTAAGTVLVKDIHPGSTVSFPFEPFSSSPQNMLPLGRTLIFAAYDSLAGFELWKSDGTTAGTVLLKDIYPGMTTQTIPKPFSSNPSGMVRFGSKVFFSATTGFQDSGYEMWSTDGSTAGTQLLLDIYPGGVASNPNQLTVAGDNLFFVAQGPVASIELFVTDGTAAGTSLLKDIRPNNASNPNQLTAVGEQVYFSATDGVSGQVLWMSDGSAAGTVKAQLITAGQDILEPSIQLGMGSRQIFFSQFKVGRDPDFGVDLWRSDGSTAGTSLVQTLWPNNNTPSPLALTLSGKQVLYSGNNALLGDELWAVDSGGTTQAAGLGCAKIGAPPQLRATDAVLGAPMTLRVLAKPGISSGALAIGFPATSPLINQGNGCLQTIDYALPFLLILFTPDLNGHWNLGLNIPNTPTFAGLRVAVRAALGPTGTSPFGLDLSNGLYVVGGI